MHFCAYQPYHLLSSDALLNAYLAEFVGREVQVVEVAESQGLFLDAESVDILYVKREFVRIGESGVAFWTRARHLETAKEDVISHYDALRVETRKSTHSVQRQKF